MEQKRGSGDMMVPIVLAVLTGMWVIGVASQYIAEWVVKNLPN
jgi:hypothetical protein